MAVSSDLQQQKGVDVFHNLFKEKESEQRYMARPAAWRLQSGWSCLDEVWLV